MSDYLTAQQQGVKIFKTALSELIACLEADGGKAGEKFDPEEMLNLVALTDDPAAINLIVRDSIVTVGRQMLDYADTDPDRFLFRVGDLLKSYSDYVKALELSDGLDTGSVFN